MALNRVVIMGRLVRDPEMRMTPNNVPVASATLACDRDFKDKSGEKQTDFIDVVVWRQTAEFFAKNFSKGRMAIVEGRLQVREWTDKEGNKRRNAEVLADSVYFGDSKPAAGNDFAGQRPAAQDGFYEMPDDGAPLPF